MREADCRSVSTARAAEMLDVSERTIRRLAERGELRGHYVGRAVRVYVRSIEEYQERNAIAPRTVAKQRKAPRHTGYLSAIHKLNNLPGAT